MWNRYTRHCPWQGNSEADQAHTASAKGAPDNKAPPLKQRDLEVMDILCMADTAGVALPAPIIVGELSTGCVGHMKPSVCVQETSV